jgi:hypothetical protein
VPAISLTCIGSQLNSLLRLFPANDTEGFMTAYDFITRKSSLALIFHLNILPFFQYRLRC